VHKIKKNKIKKDKKCQQSLKSQKIDLFCQDNFGHYLTTKKVLKSQNKTENPSSPYPRAFSLVHFVAKLGKTTENVFVFARRAGVNKGKEGSGLISVKMD
jgi:hypothetical protein